jgi:MscS family membrane protein
MAAFRQGNEEVAPLYLDTNLTGKAAVELARKLYVVLNSRLPARLNEVSDSPEGARDNILKPNQTVVGVINSVNGPFEVIVERVTRGQAPPVWVFSRETLKSVPDAYAEIDLVDVDRFLPDILARPRVFGVRLFAWLFVILILPVFYQALGSLRWLFRPLVALWQRRRGVSGRPVLRHVPGLLRLAIMGIAIRWLLASLQLPLLERQFWATVATLLLVIAVGWALLLLNGYGERYLLRRFSGGGDISSLLRLTRRVADVLVVAACGIATLRYFGFDPTAALAGLGIGGIAVALAAQKTLENVIAGLSLIFDKAVTVGDAIKFGDTEATVDYIGLRSTRLRTVGRTILTVPNGQIASVGIETLSMRDKFWFRHVVGLQYGTTAGQMRSLTDRIQSLLAAHRSVEPGSARVRFFRLGPSSLDIEVVAYLLAVDGGRFLEIQQELLLSIMEAVDASGTAIAFPSQTLYMADRRDADRHGEPAAQHAAP